MKDGLYRLENKKIKITKYKMEVIILTDEQEQPVKKPISYEPVQDAEVHVECGDSTEEQINYEPKPEAEVFIEKGAKKSEKNE